ncbi:peptidylprolyl isomerase [Usitatibacter palustris]|uniref:peptidylprolyl isomerase n=1 Tax=Usitatibacter palustris TaxID=2732487 RepID=A0A6M4H7X8_9PROT|nr:peptidylprolyl isomerase [Usitatibacter palustris]QJR14097.1 putative parvulin-type peptidyl-prolyl cis-trans isomerase [Usitatibacter palustris]
MQLNVKNLAVALIAGCLVLPVAAQDKAEKAEKKAPKAAAAGSGRIVVNGVTIPASRVEALNKELSAQGQPETPERANAVKEELINREVLVQAASKRGLDKEPGVMAAMEMARQAVLVRALFEAEMKAHPITDDMLKQQYETFKTQMGANEYKVRHILVDKEEDAKAITADLAKGGDFAKIAKEKSKDPGSKDNGGDLDWGPSARYVKPFADAVTTLQKGQTTAAPVKTDFGWHVIRLDDSRPMKVPEFAEVKEQFRQRAQQQAIQRMVGDLRSKAKVEER